MKKTQISRHETERPFVGLVALVFSILIIGTNAFGQVITDTANNTNFNVSITFPTLTPGSGGVLSSQQATVRLRCACNPGYHLKASLVSFTVTPTAPVSGGTSISRSDIGMGITSITGAATGTIVSGFNYNPSTATVTNGLTPFTGAASGQATLNDIAAGNVNIFSGPKIAGNENLTGGASSSNFVALTFTFAVLPQYWTPATVNAVINLQIVSP
jgi:hypothetical protein